MKPLPKDGQWARLPKLKTRSGTLHEYAASASDGHLSRIVWTDAHIGNDQRKGAGEGQPFLLYPRDNRLHIAFSALQWT
ncbi:hypothetical protein A241_05019, partial [Pseudomonas syringae pv. actinidiae ICMP 19094]